AFREAAVSESAVSYSQDADAEPGRGRGLLAYVLLAYGFSWVWLVPLAVTGVNGQFAVPVFGQVKVPTPAAVFRASRGVLRVWW
ncbi:MAG TPA: hypothetical protein VII33_00650, partial [Nakamurella sp.]